MRNEEIKIVVAHPGRQHSFHVATALEHYDMLHSYATTVYDKETSILMTLAKLFLKGDSIKRAKKRKCPDVSNDKVVQFQELRGLLILALLRIDKKQRLYRKYDKFVSKKFQLSLAKYIIKNNISAVISYDTNSTTLFNILNKKAPNVIKIIDHAHACRNYLYKVYNEKPEKSGPFYETFKACGYLTDSAIANRFGEEAKLADLHIVASSFSKDALEFNGIKSESIMVVPYGVDGKAFKGGEKKCFETLKLLFVGEVNQRKGIYQILEAAKQLSGENIEFNIVGTGSEVAPELYEPYKKYVNFLGAVTFDKMPRIYSENHVFIFPTMGEGFGLVVPEALSSGLPVIASRNCCAKDLIVDGENGFLIDAGETEQLVEKIKWFYRNMDSLHRLSENAIKSVKDLTWENYERNLTTQLKEKIGEFTQ